MALMEKCGELMEANKFSVLMSVYCKENSDFFNRCMQSIWTEQRRKPNEIVLVRDGPLTLLLDEAIDSWQDELGDVLCQVSIKKNRGLGNALKLGLEKCSYEFVARMDTDDISLPERFEKQMRFFDNNSDIDVVGSWVSEFEGSESNVYAYRRLPTSSDELFKFAKNRCPLNHVTVMFKKSKVMLVGNYGNQYFSQDYFLWSKLLMNGSKFANIPEVLVNVRAGIDMIRRRGGVKYALTEYKIQKEFLDTSFITYAQFFKNIFIRVPVRLLPQTFRILAYKLIRTYL